MKAARRSADPGDPFPKRIPLKLTRLVTEPPTGPAWIHEIKHDGYRMLAYRNGRIVLLETRNKHDWTARFPRLVQELQALKARQVVLDCELCALLPDGVTSFHQLQSALAANRTDPLALFAFDLLFLNGKDLRRLPLTERKAQLAKLLSATPRKRILYVDHIENAGKVFFNICCEAGLEGIISKRKDRPYVGGRSDWVKTKCNVEETFIVGGFVYGGTKKSLGELLVGRRKGRRLEYAGRVGFGFTVEGLRSERSAARGLPTAPQN